MAFRVLIMSIFAFLAFSTVSVSYAFKPNTHLLTGNIAIEPILDGVDAVIINGDPYDVDPRVADAIRSYPDFYRGGVVGPDAFPDIYVGQSRIHPDTRCDGGLLPNSECVGGPGYSFSYEWLRHIYESGWDYYSSRNGDDEGKKALAFVYGFLTHAAGDIWAHTLVNGFAEGIFPGPTEIIEDPAKLPYATRHIIVESYIGEHTPETVLTINSPSEYIFRVLIDSEFVDSEGNSAQSLGRGDIFESFYALKDQLTKDSVELQNRAIDLQNEADACRVDDLSCSRIILLGEKVAVEQLKAYTDEWIKDIDSGLQAWPIMSQDVAYNLFTNTEADHMDRVEEVVDEFVGNHLLSMMGAPDEVGAAYNLVDDIFDYVNERVDIVARPVEEIKNYIILQSTGLDFPALKAFYSNPSTYVNEPGNVMIGNTSIEIGLPEDTSQKLDALMGISHGLNNPSIKFEPDNFAAVKNTIAFAKLLLLSPENINQLLFNYGAIPLYDASEAISPEGESYPLSNIMLDFPRSLDANHQWRMSSIRIGDVRGDDSPRQHGEGMPLWMSCSARENVFRTLLVDWENTNFPDLGEECIEDVISSNTTTTPPTTTTTECDPSSPLLTRARGSEGPKVTELQGYLSQLGYYNGPINGIYDDLTHFAVEDFQRANGLAVDGDTGPNTWAVLCEVLAANTGTDFVESVTADTGFSDGQSIGPSDDTGFSDVER